jgi:catechol 2,3-dioxygenase-like lactoylglutathione lyase family enzyme
MTSSAKMLSTLDHVILAVRNLDSARADYERLLGLEPSWQGAHPGAGTANVLFRLENTCLELLSPVAAGPMAAWLAATLDERGDGLLGLAFGTDDLEACRATLLERGLEPGAIEAGEGRDLATGAERRWRRAPLPLNRTRGIVVFPIQHESPADTLPMATPTGDFLATVHALDHAVVQSTDGDATRELFGGGLGLRLAVDKAFPDWAVRLLFFRIGGVTVEVACSLPGVEKSAAMPVTETDRDRLFGMSYRVRSIEAARERLARASVDVSEVRSGRRPGTRVFTVRSGTCGVPTLILEMDERAAPRSG